MLIAPLLVLAGMVILFGAGHALVQGATAVALLARVSMTIVALTVVSIGTSAPELAVSLLAALEENPDISYANVVGSNVFNVGLILGIAAVLAVIPVHRQTLVREYPFMLGVTLLAIWFAWSGQIVTQREGAVLVALLVAFVVYMVMLARGGEAVAEMSEVREAERMVHLQEGRRAAWRKNIALVIVGILGLAGGAELTVRGAVMLAEFFSIEQRVIGLTVVAMGTSLPELATTVVAARKGEQEIALGNVVGSNIFNLLAVLGITAVAHNVEVHERALALDNWVMLGFTVALLPIMLWRRKLSRSGGVLLLVGFVTYMTLVLIRA
jgi:cation:H+ antiporter